jgi:hypothetical protein
MPIFCFQGVNTPIQLSNGILAGAWLLHSRDSVLLRQIGAMGFPFRLRRPLGAMRLRTSRRECPCLRSLAASTNSGNVAGSGSTQVRPPSLRFTNPTGAQPVDSPRARLAASALLVPSDTLAPHSSSVIMPAVTGNVPCGSPNLARIRKRVESIVADATEHARESAPRALPPAW